MSDVLAAHQTLRELMKQPGMSIGAGLVAAGLGGLVAAVVWLSSLSPSSPRIPSMMAETPHSQGAEKRPSDSGTIAMPHEASIVTGHAESVVERPAPLPVTLLAQPAPVDSQAVTAEIAASTAGTVLEPLRSSEPVAITDGVAPETRGSAPDEATAGVAEPPPTGALEKGYRLQLGSVRTLESAHHEWQRLELRNGNVLKKLGYTTARVDLGDRGIFYRIQTGPMADAAVADRACKELKRRGVGCILVKP